MGPVEMMEVELALMTNPFAAVTPAGSTGSGGVPVSTAEWPLPVVAGCTAQGRGVALMEAQRTREARALRGCGGG